MYFQLSAFYIRDIYFEYDDDNNDVSQYNFTEGVELTVSAPLIYTIDKLDKYLKTYDVLPTFGPPLVSEKFRQLYSDLDGTEVQFFPALIEDAKGNRESGFYAMNILKRVPCLDTERSVTEKTSYGTLKIKKLFILPNALQLNSIVRMEEHESYIIVTQNFKDRFEKANLQGADFVEEGNSIYNDV